LLGGKVEEVEKNLLFFLPLATKPRTFSFFLKGGLRCLGGFFFSSFGEITSNSIWRNTSSYKFLEEEKQDQLSSGEDEGE
jgi:hypothetical protein